MRNLPYVSKNIGVCSASQEDSLPTRKTAQRLLLVAGLLLATALMCDRAGAEPTAENSLVSYCELFDDNLAMYQVGDKTTPGIRNTEFIVGNEFLFARTGGWHPFAGAKCRSLTTLDCFCGSREHPQSTESLFAWPFVDGEGWGGRGDERAKQIVSYRCSCLYYSVNGGKYQPLGAAGVPNVRVSYVLGSAVVKAMIEAEQCSFDLYTYAPPGLPAVCRYLVIRPKRPLEKLSVICYSNPVMPDEDVSTHQTGMRYGDAANDRVAYERDGFTFKDEKYPLCLRVACSQPPAGYGCRDISKIRDIQKYYRDLGHLQYEADAASAAGDVEAVLRFDYTDLKAPQSLLFTYVVGHQPDRVKEVSRNLVNAPQESLDRTVAWWREWLGYHEPSSKAEALIQQGLISIKTMQTCTGAISAGTTWSNCFLPDCFHHMEEFLLPYGNFTAHWDDMKNLLAFHEKASEKYADATASYTAIHPDFSTRGGRAGSYEEFHIKAFREYLKKTGDVDTTLTYQGRAEKIIKYLRSQAGDDHLIGIVADDSVLRLEGLGKQGWPASFDSSLSLWCALDFLESLAIEVNSQTKAKEYRQEKDAVIKAIEAKLVSPEGLYGAISPDGKLHAHITSMHLEYICLGAVPGRLWHNWLQKAKEDMLMSVSTEGKKMEWVSSSPHFPARRETSMWGGAGYLAMAALKAGDDALAARAVRFMLNSASAHGTWAESLDSHRTFGALNFGWNTGPNIAGLFAYYIGLMPLERGYDRPFQIHPHDLEKILAVGKSFGAGKAFQITRLGDTTYRLRLPLLSKYTAGRYALSASRPIFADGKETVEVSRENLIAGIEIDNLSNTKIVFTPQK